MSASEFVELEIDNDDDKSSTISSATSRTTTTTTTTTTTINNNNTDTHRFLDDEELHSHSGQQRKFKVATIVAASLFCFVILLIIIVAISSGVFTEYRTPNITALCASPVDPEVTDASLYHIQAFYIPLSYSVFFGFNSQLEGNTTASVDIQLTPLKKNPSDNNCNWIWLNTDASRIFDLTATASVDSNQAAVVASVVHHPTIDVVGIQLPPTTMHELSTATAGATIVLHLNYRLEVGAQLDGIYVSTWTDDAGASHKLVASQMEATSARRALPCLDQPSDKATFHVSVGCTDCDSHTVLGNMPEQIGEGNFPSWSQSVSKARSNYINNNKHRIVTFQETPSMSTYLLALTIGELDYVEEELAGTKSGDPSILIRIYTTVGSKDLGKYALVAAKTVLELYQKQFNLNFPLPKCDMVAIPDFAAGAMENWGLVLYRETALLVDPLKSSDADKQRVAVVVAHELAHQWFGNLVTMEWWNDLWLNEGFATYTEYQGTDAIDPAFYVWNQFLRSVTQPALALDGTKTGTHGLHQPVATVATPGAIEELFDTIDYEKGGAVVRMIASALDRQHGDGVWKASIERYLTAHKYGNAKASDLWSAAAQEVGETTISEKLTTWSNQVGFPLVKVSVLDQGGRIGLTQTRFFNAISPEKKDEAKWWVPITYVKYSKSGASSESTLAFKATDIKACEMNVDSTSSCNALINSKEECLKLNIGTVGFYRVQYDLSEWECLLDTFHTLPSDDRSGLMDDVFSIARSSADEGILSDNYHVPMSFANQLKTEQDLTVWSSGLSHLMWMGNILSLVPKERSTSLCATSFKAFFLQVVGPRVTQLGIVPDPKDNHLTRLLRIRLVGAAASHGHQATIDAAKAIYADPKQRNSLSPDEQSIVYRAVVRWGDAAVFNEVLAMYRAATFAPEKKRYMYALASSRDPALIQRVLNMAINPKEVRGQDTVSLLAAVASYTEGSHPAWAFVKEHWSTLYETYGSGGFALTRLVLIASNFVTKEMLDDVSKFFTENPVPAAERAVARAKEEVGDASSWSERSGNRVCVWLSKQ